MSCVEEAETSTDYPQVIVTCLLCSDINAAWYCKNCPGSLCGKCAEEHKTHSNYNVHSMVPRSYTMVRLHGPAKIAEQCKIHSDKEITTYCKHCKVPCCVACLAESHQLHPVLPIENVYLPAELMLNDYVKELDEDVIPKLDQMGDHLLKYALSNNDLIAKVEKEVKAYGETLKNMVDHSCDSLLERLHGQASKHDVENIRKEIRDEKQKVENTKRDIIDKIQEGKLDLIEYHPPKYNLLIPSILIPKSGRPSFIPNKSIYHEIIQHQIGEIGFSDVISVDVDKPWTVYKSSSFPSKIHATSITLAGENEAWVMYYGSNTMYLFDVTGREVKAITVKGSGDINGMSITHSRDMIFTNEDKKVRRVSRRREVSVLIDTAPFSCYGACLNEKEEIVVCMSDQDERNHVAIYSPDGSRKLSVIRGRDYQGKQLVTDPYRVTSNGEDLCILNISKSLVCVDREGNVMWVYEGEQAKLGRPFYPLGLCVDKHHNILVTDNNNDCVHHVDKDGKLIQVILTQDKAALRMPWGICVDDATGLVWVGNNNKEITTVKYNRI
ncbi:hypothetical protein FSP39_003087 [Pinctada imbricata]|uniref:B box-type domain-containing protein n=1 Tax=Pinctada imbricata TaxID=66713 RepID=A0AA88XU47_PINIB|nr:hypothetical protein FSP39_003087 [Pinctada imbricata]